MIIIRLIIAPFVFICRNIGTQFDNDHSDGQTERS